MIKKLRIKFILILMSVVAVILLAVFAALLISTMGNNRRTSQDVLRQALSAPFISNGFLPLEREGRRNPAMGTQPYSRMPILLIGVDKTNRVTVIMNQLFYLDDSEVNDFISFIIDDKKTEGVLQEYSLRWLKSDDKGLIAFTDISAEQEMLKTLIINSLLIGSAALVLFFLISLFLSKWAVMPVERAWERQRQFIADASHELKTPLTVILSNAYMLSREEEFSDIKKARRMEHIQSEAGRMKRLVEDLLSLAKSDKSYNKKSSLTLSRLDFSDIVTNAVLAMESVIYDEKRKLSYQIDDNLFVSGNNDKLKQLLSILLDNAVKYSPLNSLIEVTLSKSEHGTVTLKIKNKGEFLSREECKQIFERFYRTDTSRIHLGGFGLGLSIAKSIVLEHKGKIGVESSKENGNTFFVSLPLI